MHRTPLLTELAAYTPSNEIDATAKQRITDFVREYPICFERSLLVGHITGSAWVIDTTGERALLLHHKKLNKWLQPGGHVDGNPNVLESAQREALEESGLAQIQHLSTDIFDLDIHTIPARGDEPQHEHFDVRYLFQAVGDNTLHCSAESNALEWIHRDRFADLDLEESVMRMVRKWLQKS